MEKEPKSGHDSFALTDLPVQQKPRSLGLRTFDFFLYPMVTNFGVFGISFFATYLTNKGSARGANGELLFGEWGRLAQKRGDMVYNGFRGAGLGHKSADMAKMVTWSFIDGCALAPVIKVFEDKREDIGKWIDTHYGNNVIDESQYNAEPKQTWGSILGGRALTAAVVVPTAVVLDKAGLNEKLFNAPGRKIGEFIGRNPDIRKAFGKFDPKESGRIAMFEIFYTSVCTAGLYYISRAIARWQNEGKPESKIETQSVEHLPPLTQEVEHARH